jgi:uncharacterized protein (DUF983 family)
LDYSFADPADGSAFFAIWISGVPSTGLAVWIETEFEAPLWVHLFTTLPFLLLSGILPLRPLKGWLIANQYVYHAAEAQIAATKSHTAGFTKRPVRHRPFARRVPQAPQS